VACFHAHLADLILLNVLIPVGVALVAQRGLQLELLLSGFGANPYPYLGQAPVFVLSSLWEGPAQRPHRGLGPL